MFPSPMDIEVQERRNSTGLSHSSRPVVWASLVGDSVVANTFSTLLLHSFQASLCVEVFVGIMQMCVGAASHAELTVVGNE